MNAERLLHLASILDNVPLPTFDIEAWECKIGVKAASAPCGFVACAVGHACLDPKFNAEGLSITISNFGGEPCYLRPGDKPLFAWDAVEAFFDLKGNEARHFFDGNHYAAPKWDVTPHMVATRIREFVTNGGIHEG